MNRLTVGEVAAAVDAELARASFVRTSSDADFIMRSYRTTLDGMPLCASLSVFLDPGTPHRLTSGHATGFELAVECTNGLATRWIVGQVPLLIGLGLRSAGQLAASGSANRATELRVDDVEWAQARLLCAATRPALEALVGASTFVEQRPNILAAKVLRFGSTELPAIGPWLDAFAAVARASLLAPAPRVAAPRLTDNRPLMILLVALFVIGAFVSCGVLFLIVVR